MLNKKLLEVIMVIPVEHHRWPCLQRLKAMMLWSITRSNPISEPGRYQKMAWENTRVTELRRKSCLDKLTKLSITIVFTMRSWMTRCWMTRFPPGCQHQGVSCGSNEWRPLLTYHLAQSCSSKRVLIFSHASGRVSLYTERMKIRSRLANKCLDEGLAG